MNQVKNFVENATTQTKEVPPPLPGSPDRNQKPLGNGNQLTIF